MADFVINPDDVATLTGTIKSRTTIEAIEKGQAVYYNTAEQAGLAVNNDAAKKGVRGIAVSKAAAGGRVGVLEVGSQATVGAVAGLKATEPMFLSATPGGLMPAGDLAGLTTGQFCVLVAFGLNTTSIEVAPMGATNPVA